MATLEKRGGGGQMQPYSANDGEYINTESEHSEQVGYNSQAPITKKIISSVSNKIDSEISKTKEKIASLQKKREQLNKPTGKEAALSEAFPLGAGGLKRTQANKFAGELAERTLNKGLKLEKVLNELNSQTNKLEHLEKLKRNESKSAEKQIKSGEPLKWKTTRKSSYVNGVYMPQIIESGDYKIVGMKVFYKEKQIGTSSSISVAKQIAERHRGKGA